MSRSVIWQKKVTVTNFSMKVSETEGEPCSRYFRSYVGMSSSWHLCPCDSAYSGAL